MNHSKSLYRALSLTTQVKDRVEFIPNTAQTATETTAANVAAVFLMRHNVIDYIDDVDDVIEDNIEQIIIKAATEAFSVVLRSEPNPQVALEPRHSPMTTVYIRIAMHDHVEAHAGANESSTLFSPFFNSHPSAGSATGLYSSC